MTDHAPPPPEEGRANLGELAYIIGTSTNTLAKVVRENADFPVAARGTNGVAYEFVVADAVAWWRAHEEKARKADDDRRAQLELWRQEAGLASADENLKGLTPAERRAEMEAALAEDRVRASRGELIDRRALEYKLSSALVQLRNGLLQVPAQFAKAEQLERKQRLALEAMITERLNTLAREIAEYATAPEAPKDAEPAARVA